MEKKLTESSMRKNTLSDIGSFLFSEGFRSCEVSSEGILTLVNLVADYYEEGQHLYPDVLVTNDMSLFKMIPSRQLLIKECELNVSAFKNAIKLCAPLAINGWVIYIEILEDRIRFGLVSTEMTETSLSLYHQTVNGTEFEEKTTFAYIRAVGQKVVEIAGIKNRIHIFLNLDDQKSLLNNEIAMLSSAIASGCKDDYKAKVGTFFEKTIDEALKNGHGNLIGVVNDNPDHINAIKGVLSDGVYLDEPINLAQYLITAECEKSNASSVAVKAYSSLLISMLNHDGITLLTNTGRVLGYHLFVRAKDEDKEVVGGARSRAFEAMKKLGLKACFYKSQDGNIKYHTKQ